MSNFVKIGKKISERTLVGRRNSFDYIPFVPLPFVAEEGVHEGASRTVVNSLPDSVTSSHRELVDVDETPSSKGRTSSSSDESEVDDLEEDGAKNKTWKLGKRPTSSDGGQVKVLTTKWVLRIKRDKHGEIKRFKARLVVHGFKQPFGREYWKTYSPVVR
ncbi:LOW QUALITY PROTEIN: Polyprotein [Phytophthora palmivora]|uniref:Polyprotein n=1 Tax=Phytophthora palmivora TaxID=4796 RepID=A0A2P4Y0D4_9STRA|nr:LOW QUALITY PROTEIN: Polyprotein [Phytophthora palmivora]